MYSIRLLLLALVVLNAPSFVYANEAIIQRSIRVVPLIREAGVAPALFQGRERALRRFLSHLQENKMIKITIHIPLENDAPDPSKPVRVEMENAVILNGEKHFFSSNGLEITYSVNSIAQLIGHPSISKILQLDSHGNRNLILYLPLYAVVTQSAQTGSNFYSAERNFEILDSIAMSVPK